MRSGDCGEVRDGQRAGRTEQQVEAVGVDVLGTAAGRRVRRPDAEVGAALHINTDLTGRRTVSRQNTNENIYKASWS